MGQPLSLLVYTALGASGPCVRRLTRASRSLDHVYTLRPILA
jgi:hypothetical protein